METTITKGFKKYLKSEQRRKLTSELNQDKITAADSLNYDELRRRKLLED